MSGRQISPSSTMASRMHLLLLLLLGNTQLTIGVISFTIVVVTWTILLRWRIADVVRTMGRSDGRGGVRMRRWSMDGVWGKSLVGVFFGIVALFVGQSEGGLMLEILVP